MMRDVRQRWVKMRHTQIEYAQDATKMQDARRAIDIGDARSVTNSERVGIERARCD